MKWLLLCLVVFMASGAAYLLLDLGAEDAALPQPRRTDRPVVPKVDEAPSIAESTPTVRKPSVESTELGPGIVARDGALTGVVLSPAGTRVAEASVEIRTADGEGTRNYSVAPPLRRVVQTDRDGAFQLEVPPDQQFTVTATAAGFAPGRVSGALPGGEISVRLLLPATLRGRVTDESSGEGLAGVIVRHRSKGGYPPTEALTDSTGGFALNDLVPGAFQFEAISEFHAQAEERQDPLGEGETREIAIALWAGKRILGRVNGPDERPVAGAVVKVGERRAETTFDGSFRLFGLSAEVCTVHASAPGLMPTQMQVDLSGLREEATIEIALRPGSSIIGIVRTIEGAVVPDAAIRIYMSWGGSGKTSVDGPGNDIWPLQQDNLREIRSDAQGVFRIDSMWQNSWGQLLVGAVLADGREGWSDCRPFPQPNETPQIDVIVGPPLAIEGRLLGPTGEGIAGARISLERDQRIGSYNEPTIVASGEDGSFVFAGLNPGQWTVKALARGFPPLAKSVRLRTTTAITPLELKFSVGQEVTGQVVDANDAPIARARVFLQAPEGVSDNAQTDLEGNFRFAAIPAPPWRLSVSAEGYRSTNKRLTQHDGAPVRLVMQPLAIFRGQVIDALTKLPIEDFNANFSEIVEPGGERRRPHRSNGSVRNADGRFKRSLEDARYRLVLTARGYLPLEVPEIVIDASTGLAEGEQLFELTPGGMIEGYVRDDERRGVWSAKVYARRRGGDDRFLEMATTETDGYFRASGLEAGVFDFVFNADRRVLETREGIPVPESSDSPIEVSVRSEARLVIELTPPKDWPIAVNKPRNYRPNRLQVDLKIENLDRRLFSLVNAGRDPLRNMTLYRMSDTLQRTRVNPPRLVLEHLPDGMYRIEARCLSFPLLTREVRVVTGGEARVTLDFKALADSMIEAERAAGGTVIR